MGGVETFWALVMSCTLHQVSSASTAACRWAAIASRCMDVQTYVTTWDFAHNHLQLCFWSHTGCGWRELDVAA